MSVYVFVVLACAGVLFLAAAIIQRTFVMLGFVLLVVGLIMQFGGVGPAIHL